uniref:Uncharacterized protein n=1 Tax=Aegilops tauschii subsp. strangulata TaxID=200361 RepID=A0A453DY72_AEGTS
MSHLKFVKLGIQKACTSLPVQEKSKVKEPTDHHLYYVLQILLCKSSAGFTGIDDPYEAPSDCEIVIQCKAGDCATPKSMADQVVSYLEANEFLQE